MYILMGTLSVDPLTLTASTEPPLCTISTKMYMDILTFKALAVCISFCGLLSQDDAKTPEPPYIPESTASTTAFVHILIVKHRAILKNINWVHEDIAESVWSLYLSPSLSLFVHGVYGLFLLFPPQILK